MPQEHFSEYDEGNTMTIAEIKIGQREKRQRLSQQRNFPDIPALENGDHLVREEFERRYAAMPSLRKAELIEGRVYMPSPVRINHSECHADIITILGLYRIATPGVRVSDNATIRLDAQNEPQPDALLRLESGRTHDSDDEYIEGSPELIIEIAGSSASFDMYEKLEMYQRNGVQEYVVWQIYEKQLNWFQLREGRYIPLLPDGEGIICSRVFPGLYVAVEALLSGDMDRTAAALQKGLESEEHAAFLQYIATEQAIQDGSA